MVHKEKFTSPARTLELIELQANQPENLKFASSYFPKFKSGIEIFKTLKPLVKFKSDPPDNDTIQGISTLFSNAKNIHGLSGLGDCDCFVSAVASIAIANKLPFQYIIQGNDKPSHIAIKVCNDIVDLTNPTANYLRNYNFTKYISPMYVSLADGSELATELADDFGRRFNPRNIVRQAVTTARRVAPPAATRIVDRNFNRINRAGAAGFKIAKRVAPPAVIARTLNRAGAAGFNRLPPAVKGELLLRKRRLMRRGFSDSEADFYALQSFEDDFGRGRKISLKRGLQNVAKAGKAVGRVAAKAAPILLPVGGAALNLIAPGAGTKIAGIANKALQRAGGAKTMAAVKALQRARQQAGSSISPAQLPESSGMPEIQTMAIPEFTTAPVTITAPKNNNALLIGAGLLGAYLLLKK